jgi:Phosphoserine aminotransferase
MLKKPIFFTVGPTKLYPTVNKHILNALKENIPSISHRSEKFINIFKESVSNLKKLLNIPADYEVFFLSSATEAMEELLKYGGKNSFI